MDKKQIKEIKFGTSWSTQFRFTQAIGRGLSEYLNIKASAHVLGPGGFLELANGTVDVIFSKWVVNEHRYTGQGIYAGSNPDEWLRTIAWLPQEDRFLFAMAPHTGITSFEEIVEKKPVLHIAGSGGEVILNEYGFSYADIEKWGGSVRRVEHTAAEVSRRFAENKLDGLWGDGSAYDFSAWPWVGLRGYRFLDVDELIMQKLESRGLRRQITPSGFIPGIDRNLLALDDSHIVVTCRSDLDQEIAYYLAKAIDEKKRDIELTSVQLDYDHGEGGGLPMTKTKYWSSLTGRIDKQWDEFYTGAPLHHGAKSYYKESGYFVS
tara:strand:+ start:2526 stop:3488 length:963 start_codon:yes stop_codon:yes gene_type:complete